MRTSSSEMVKGFSTGGSTGGSTGPHLHYEVIYLGKQVNPVNYFNRNMTSDEYRQLMENMKYNADLETLDGTSNDEN